MNSKPEKQMSNQKEIKLSLVNKVPLDPNKSILPIKFLGDRVLIEPIEPDKFFANGIAKPENFVEPFRQGKIMNIGGGEYGTSIPACCKAGHTIFYYHQQAMDFTDDKDRKKIYHLVRVSDIFAIP